VSETDRSDEKKAASTVATIRDVAAQAGVSTATVSRVLSGGGNVRADLADRVRQAAAALRYQPNRLARNLRVRETQVVGVIIPNIENSFFTAVIRAVDEVLQQASYSILLGIYYDCPARERAVAATFRAEATAGILFTPGPESAGAYEALLDAGVPMVSVSRRAELPVDFVGVTNYQGAYDATRHLIQLRHRRIGFINGPCTVSTAVDRHRGVEAAFRDASLAMTPELEVETPWTHAGGYLAAKKLLALSERPTAILAGNNLQTLGALEAIHESKLEIPRDIAVVGIDEMPWATSLRPSLTTVTLPCAEVGRVAAQLLLDRIKDSERTLQNVELPTKLVIRASCGWE
jgi:DNA-binding LacI/PurR family transcriptional regulator